MQVRLLLQTHSNIGNAVGKPKSPATGKISKEERPASWIATIDPQICVVVEICFEAL